LSPEVSIICPFRDAAAFIPGLIANVLQQTHPDWELLLIDDGSLAGPNWPAPQHVGISGSDSCERRPARPTVPSWDPGGLATSGWPKPAMR
jgi:hypothetical protein